ncbi:hypothetical protein PML80_06000 [Aerococcus urinaeequi]|uniref:Uncharacterized protein n=1 Tax=Aerococcus urinaeequi TaxID=51665 RepID=A0AAE9XGU3_9LACT|nr:hypothetical protein [Aerococcus urinaeequi]WCG37077.1 hypothetical protein PML80_06000 [Aerococcus urinaeequi]
MTIDKLTTWSAISLGLGFFFHAFSISIIIAAILSMIGFVGVLSMFVWVIRDAGFDIEDELEEWE